MMKKTAVLLFVALSLAPMLYANSPDNCAQQGNPFGGPYDFIADGGPYYDGCWSKQLITYHDATVDGSAPICTPLGYAYSTYWKFERGGTSVLSQTIPVSSAATNLTLLFNLDFDDPHWDYNDVIYFKLTDTTTNTVLFLSQWVGSNGNPCARMKFDIYNSTNLNGHTLLLQFIGSQVYSYTDVNIRVKGVSLITGIW